MADVLSLDMPRMLPLLNEQNEHVRWIDEHEARKLLALRLAIALWASKRIRALRERSAAEKPRETVYETSGRMKPLAYSHNRETEDNPAGVWTFRRLSKAA